MSEPKFQTVGDVAMRNSMGDDEFLDRRDVKNGDAFTRNIYDGDIYETKEPSNQYAYYWHRADGSEFAEDEYDDLIEAGYFLVNKKKFTVKRWRETAEGQIKSGRCILMAITAEEYRARLAKKLERFGAEVDAGVDGFHGIADSMGVGSFETRGGESREVAKGRNTSSILKGAEIE